MAGEFLELKYERTGDLWPFLEAIDGRKRVFDYDFNIQSLTIIK